MKNTAISFVRAGLRSVRALGVAALALGLHAALAQHAGHGAVPGLGQHARHP